MPHLIPLLRKLGLDAGCAGAVRPGDLVEATVLEVFDDFVVAGADGWRAVLHLRERSPQEPIAPRPGDRVLAVVVGATPERVTLSQAHAAFIARLLEREVPEIRQGLVRIEAIARSPGDETKVALSSTDPAVEAVGACRGPGGSRARAVTAWAPNELLSFVDWHPEPATFAARAMAPVVIRTVYVDEEAKLLELVIADEDLPRAVGRRGAHIRMAAMLVGWRLDVLTVGRVLEFRADLVRVPGLEPTQVRRLVAHQVRGVAALAETEVETLAEILEIETTRAERLVRDALALLSSG